MFAENLAVFFADFGVACTAGTYAFTGILDTPDESMNMAGVNLLSTMYELICKTTDVHAAGIATGSSITAAGNAYVVRDVMLEDDGAITKLTLSR